MVIMGLTSGLANQMYEYAAAYALSREIKQELVLDITECVNSGGGGYFLDFLSIPTVAKMIYFVQNSECEAHTNIRRIPKGLKEKVIVLAQEEQEGAIQYKSLNEFVEKKYCGDIYLCGYFFDRDKYYDKYWNEIKQFFRLKVRMREVDIFQELIQNKISVGIHIRRGDMLLVDWAEKMEDDYYRAAIVYCRKHLDKDGKKCSFFVFSDDVTYAKQMLGKDSSLWYVNFGGSREASVAEFVCLSLCNHRILSNDSTFSELAAELNTYKDKRKFYQGKKEKLTWRDYISKTFWGVVLSICGKSWQNACFNEKEIKKYSRRYRTDNSDNIQNYQKRKEYILETEITEKNYGFILEEIAKLSTNAYERSIEEEKRFLYQKFIALIKAKEYSSALAIESKIYEDFADDELFRKNLVKALTEIGAYKEANMEQSWEDEKKHFVIIPAGKSCASARRCGLVELGITLHHFGHKVSFILEPLDELEKHYISNNEIMTDRRGYCFGCHQYLQEDVEREGFDKFLERFQEDELFVITRKRKFCDRFEGKKVTYIFPDFSDRRDAENKVGEGMPKEEIEYLYKKADVIMTQNADIIPDDQKYILWKDNDHQEEYWLENRRWQFCDLDRFSERAICMAESIHKYVQ